MRRALALILPLVLLASCSGDDDSDDASNTTTETDAPTTTADESTDTTGGGETTTTQAPDLNAVAVTLTEVGSGLDSPIDIAFREGDARMYVVQQGGSIVIVENGSVVGDPVLEVEVSGGNEQGLLGMDFSNDGDLLYVNYTDPNGDTHVDEYAMNGDVADVESKRELLFVDQPFANHNGGEVRIGPDEMLYIGLGDGGAGGDPLNSGQSLDTLLGKILRIDPRAAGDGEYSIPDDNPFVERVNAAPEVWMYGLRNPWRFSFDRATDDVWIGDVGQDAYEEIDFTTADEAAGSNWGWNVFEGTHTFNGGELPDMRAPIFEMTHADENCSVTGGYVYRGDAIPAMRGVYVFADYCRGHLTGLVQSNGALAGNRELGVQIDEVTSFGEDADGELYVSSRGGSIFRIDPT